MSRKSYIPILLTIAILCSPLQADGWTPAWIVALFKKYQNRTTSKSLEQYPVYKEFKERFPQNAPSVLIETKIAEELVEKGVLYTFEYNCENNNILWEKLKNELRMREFLKEHHITQFNDPVQYVMYEKNNQLECRKMLDTTEFVGDENSPLKTINQEQLKELVTILTQTGMKYWGDLSVDPTTGKLDHWLIMDDWVFFYTNRLSAFEDFYSKIQASIESEKLWEMYITDNLNNPCPKYLKGKNIITKDGQQWLENYYHTLRKECLNADKTLNESCDIIPLPKRKDLEK